MYQDRKVALGSAFTKDKQYLYTWWADGSVSRMPALGKYDMLKDLKSEDVVPSVDWNKDDFLPLMSNIGIS